MLTKDEEAFFNYWQQQRLRKKQFLRKLSIGLPLGVFIAAAVMINFMSGWYLRAEMDIRKNSSIIIVILIALIGIVVFVTIFSAHYRWDQNEQHFNELLKKKQNEATSKIDLA